MLPLAASADLHDHLATNLNCVRLDRFRLFVARQRNGFANLLRNVAASTTLKPRAVICISPSSTRNSTLSPQHFFNYCFRWIFTRSVLKASFSYESLHTRNSVQSHELNYCYCYAHQQHISKMKYRYVAIAASAATGVSAQAPPAYTPPVVSTPANSLPVAPISSPPVSYTTVTYDDCPSQSIQTLITVTNGVTVTYCPECQHSISPSASPVPSHTTVYTTVYQSLCSTGLVPVTYTVTEECAEPTPTWATGTAKDDHVPQGFTVTVKDCHVCDKTPVPVTITEPCKDGCGKPTPRLQLPLLLPRQVAATSSRFPTARFKLLARQAALEETTRQHHLAAMEAQDRPHHLAEPPTPALAAPTLVLSVLLLRATTPSAPARNVLTMAHHHLATGLQHLAARQPTVETHLTRLATAPPTSAPVLSASSPVAVPAATLTLPMSKSLLVARAPFRSALFHRSAWPVWLLLLLSHSDRSTIKFLGHSVKVRHVSPHNHDRH